MSQQMPEVVTEVEARARELYDQALQPLGARFEFDPPPPASETRGLPMVLLLGNHSSGKSSFVNHLVGEEIQRTGIAPIDDGFTIISHGPEPLVRDGTTVVTNPDLPFGDLARFGPQLTSHLKLVQRPAPALSGLALVDSPGMIDAAGDVDRGYDFPGVVRWFAERADVIMLLFDPDKPGTTGETLTVLIESLAGLDHKLLLIFNKVDRFETMRDYARAYGALCWNLSKAIPRKDLPHIYNTYLPGHVHPEAPAVPLDDFDKQRAEVEAEVKRAPLRRVDNVISRLYEHARRLRMHVRVLDRLARERVRLLLRHALQGLVALALGGSATWLGFSLAGEDQRWKVGGGLLLLTLAVLGGLVGLFWWDRRRQKEVQLDALFERTYARELTLGDQAEDLRALWQSVRDRVRRVLEARPSLPLARRGELKRLEKVIGQDVPALRARAANAGAPVSGSSFAARESDRLPSSAASSEEGKGQRSPSRVG